MKKLIIVSIVFCVVQVTFGQQKSRADRFFEKKDYINAAKYYEEDLSRKSHKKDLENIATSYYNIFDYRNAALYLKRLVAGKFVESDKIIDNEYYFKLYQVLSALGDYETALVHYETYNENRSVALNTEEAIETIEEFKLKNADYTVTSVDFNSEASDFGAIKFRDSVYFTSARGQQELFGKTYKWTHEAFLDVYAVRVNEKIDTLGAVSRLPKHINTKLHDGNFCFSNDGLTLYLSRSNYKNGKKQFDEDANNNIHLYRAIVTNGQWSDFEKLPFNNDAYSYQHPALSTDGTKLYFSSNQEGGMGSFDLYYVEIKGDTFGEPINLGETINTPNREHFPFISEDGNLFFASNGHLGLGMLDNFVSEMVDGRFTTPINLGAPINSRYDDFNLNYYNTTEGFFASNRTNTNDDIYKFTQIGEIFIREYINTFEVRDEVTDAFVPNTKVELYDSKGKLIYDNTLDSIASFNKNMLAGTYQLKATNDLYQKGELRVTVLEEQDQKHILYLKVLPPPAPVDPVEAIIAEKKIDKSLEQNDPKRFEMLTDVEGPPIVEKDGKLFFDLKPIYFDFDMWNIRADSKIVLDELAAKLERFPDIRLKISSHTDMRGSVRYNQILSERRAEATRNYLALEGFVNARRLQFQGFGELNPVVDCPVSDCTEEEHQLNRRSEFEIIEY